MNDTNMGLSPSPGTRDNESASSETLLKLYAMIENKQGSKKWSPESTKAAEELLAEAVFSGTSGPAEQRGALSMAQDLPIAVIESVFLRHWPTLAPNRKNLLISELMKLNSDRSLTRQVAIAERIVGSDRDSSAQILQALIDASKKGSVSDFWPGLSKEKKELIRSRFGNREWVYFNLPDESVMRSLLAGFVEALTESKTGRAGKKTQRCLYDFARWALSTLKRIRVDDATGDLVRQRVMHITRDFPIEWKKELDAIANDTSMNGSSTSGLKESSVGDITISSTDTTTNIPLESPPATLSAELPTPSAVEALVKRKRAEVAHRRASVELLQNDINSVEGEVDLLQKLLLDAETSELSNVALNAELDQMKLQIDVLRSAIIGLESDLVSTRAACQAAGELSSTLTARNAELKKSFEEEKAARVAERRELEEEVERMAGVKLDGFKTRLAKSLKPIFKNKRNTDDQEPTSRLSEFLRSWFDEIEDQLTKLGVQLSKDV